MKITKRQLKRIIKEEKARLVSEISAEQAARINAEQSDLQSQAQTTRLMGELHHIIDQLIGVIGTDEVALELEGIAHDLMGS
jgi:PP-loop superfamily ATP-utilizing enzyme